MEASMIKLSDGGFVCSHCTYQWFQIDDAGIMKRIEAGEKDGTNKPEEIDK